MERKLVELRLKEVECSEAIKQEEDKMEEIRKEFAPEQKLLTQQRQEIDERQKILNKDMVGNSTNYCEFIPIILLYTCANTSTKISY